MKFITFLFLISYNISLSTASYKLPTIFISVLVRNKAHTLPYFLSLLENQEYEKKRISLLITSDHNIDNSIDILQSWIKALNGSYHSIEFVSNKNERQFSDESSIAHWSELRIKHIINLRESSLHGARRMWADFALFLDADVFLTNPLTFKYFVMKNFTIAAPMLQSTGFYSNFWCGMTNGFYYKRTEDYEPMLKREVTGCFNVPMVHSAVFINLRKTESDKLTYDAKIYPNYHGPDDDIITFAVTANMSGIPLYICNDEVFGYVMVPLEENGVLEIDIDHLTNIKLDALVNETPLKVNNLLQKFLPTMVPDKLGLDAIYVVNLRRREERRRRMEESLNALNLDAVFIDAVDGRSLNDEALQEMGVRQLEEYKDPYSKRPMTLGEIGCFLSHYGIWQKIVENEEKMVMILEDDIRFEPFFRQKMENVLSELQNLKLNWNLVYLGRKRLKEEEKWVEGSRLLVHATYSYWTLGYLITLEGARKLLNQDPLSKLLPVDEYIPIMFDNHPEESWKSHFSPRNLFSYSAAPLLLFPTHYTGQTGYISDTENSSTFNANQKIKDDL